MDLPIIICRSLAGDERAFAALFDRYKNLVFKTAYLLLGNSQDAEDALQEVFVKVYKSLSDFQLSKGAFTTWLYRITLNHCLNWRRKRLLVTLSLDQVCPMSLTDHSSLPEGRADEEADIQQAVHQLSEKQRVVVILRYYLDLSYAEISQILDIPVGTVKSRLNLALKNLHKELYPSAKDASAPGISHSKEMME